MSRKSRKTTPPAETVPAAKIAEVIGAAVPLRARSVRDLDPDEAAKQVALYEAALAGDTAEFERLRDVRE